MPHPPPLHFPFCSPPPVPWGMYASSWGILSAGALRDLSQCGCEMLDKVQPACAGVQRAMLAVSGVQELMQGGLLGTSLPQPIGQCLSTMEKLMMSEDAAPVMSSSWQKLDILNKAADAGASKVRIQSLIYASSLTQHGEQLFCGRPNWIAPR